MKTNSNLPEIIVTIVIDQGGQQYYKAHPEVPVHISEIKKEAAYFINAIVGHVDTETAVGHAAIGTGAYPRKNGIAGNGYLIPSQGKLLKNEIYAIDEISVNPTELLTETLADVLDNEYQNKSEVVSQSYALRASIGMAGHGSSPITGVNYQGDKDSEAELFRKVILKRP
ncbi:MAG: alkaline phosphatase family protein [Leptospiraceae bacterium]|nr:alkaline phosphatase family protein [Leptospiraceae bacterium]